MTPRSAPLLLSAFLILAAFSLASAQDGRSQSWADHYRRSVFLPAPAAAFGGGLLGYANPATVRLVENDLRFAWTTEGTDYASIGDWGLFATSGNVGFAAVTRRTGTARATDYRFSLGFGDRGLAGGIAYQWTSGAGRIYGLENMVSAGAIGRPDPHLSVGLTANVPTQIRTWEAVGEIGVRPTGTPRATLFADAALREGGRLSEMPWSAGASVEVVPGLRLVGRYFHDERVTAGLRIDLGRAGGGAHVAVDEDGSAASATYLVRAGRFTPNALAHTRARESRRVEIELDGRVDYRSSPLAGLFGGAPSRFYEILDQIRAATEDERVGVIAVRLAGASILPEHAWEIRDALRGAREAGRTVIVYVEDAGMTGYHLASVADRVVMDPMGTFLLPGYLSNSTYLAGALEKLGLGFDAWRYFEYKSAVEPLSRREMSEADRGQRQAYVDDLYELVQGEIAAGRGVSEEELDRLIDRHTYFTADQAVEAGLADTLARWHERDELIDETFGRATRTLAGEQLLADHRVTRTWGRSGRIALVYGLGPTARETGMRARSLAETVRELGEDGSVDAIVFRVDSPGGDPLAADLVAEAIRGASERKPVVVSQGQVAGSGGYWVSMYGDLIVAGPNTVTGSIGVIGGWLYDLGFADRLGLSADHVQRGAHADVTAGVSLLGMRLPERRLTEEETRRVRTNILAMYDQFVTRVAEGRDTTEAHVRSVAEGRIYSGTDGVEAGLVDRVGGLLDALAAARDRAELPDDRPVAVIERGGRRGIFSLRTVGTALGLGSGDAGSLGVLEVLGGSGPAGADPAKALLSEPLDGYLRMMSRHQPGPLLLLRPGTYPTYEDRTSR